MTTRPNRHPLRAKLVHAARVVLVAVLLLLIPPPSADSVSDGSIAPSLDQLPLDELLVDERLGNPLRIMPDSDAGGMWQVVDSQDELLALVARTLPAAADVVGYRGPTEASIVLDPNLRILRVGVLDSADTEEHVEAVAEDREFFRQFERWPWGGPDDETKIDAVSGATLTSMALAEGVLKRIGGTRPSLVFSEPLSVDEILDWLPDAASVDEAIGEVRDHEGKVIGRVIRTGAFCDDLVGYQGPTELLLKLSPDDRIDSIRIRRSFDNEPYVDYVRTEIGFWKIFAGKSLAELARFVPQDAGVEGVSGATMTSLVVADTIVAAARRSESRSATSDSSSPPWYVSIRWTRADIATIITLILAACLSRLGWFHLHMARRVWLIAVLLVIGLWSGNLISMALIAGWSAEGVAWRLAPGLAAITTASLLIPPLAKSNPYCNHLCPHGAVQQWIKPSSHSPRHRHLSRRATRWLTRIPGATLVVAYLTVTLIPTVDLASWEPFHAYLFRIAPWASFGLALVTLVLASVIPMGYCRLGCPTGRLLDYLRRSAVSDRIETSDYVAMGLLLISLTVRWNH